MNYELFQHKTQHNNTNKKIFLINMTREEEYYFSNLVDDALIKYIKQGKKIGILVNKKGFYNGVICNNCGHIPQCKNCSVPISYHKGQDNDYFGLCHICKTQYNLVSQCPSCKTGKLDFYGAGAERYAQMIKEKYKTNSLIINSQTAGSISKIQKIKNKLNDYQIIMGTSLLNTPIYGFKFDLIIFLNADLGLNIPDYSANENNFYFLYDTFKYHATKTFLVQTHNPDHYSIRKACAMDKKGFYEIENKFREKNNYPPFADLCLILYKNEIEERLFSQVDKLHKELLYLQTKYKLNDTIQIFSTPPLIYKIFGKYRYNIIIKGKNVRNFMDIVYTKLNLAQRGFKVDREAISIV